jgi:hypothetical protein
MPIVIEKANLRFSKSQFDIMENYKPFITKGFVSLIGVKTSLQSIKLLSYCVIRELPNCKVEMQSSYLFNRVAPF